MTSVGTALNLGEKMKIYPQVQTTAKKWTKVKNARAGRAKLLFCPLNIQIYKFVTFSLPSPFSLLKLPNFM